MAEDEEVVRKVCLDQTFLYCMCGTGTVRFKAIILIELTFLGFQGSALYHHLLETGFTNFESYELNPKDTQWFQPLKESPGNSLSVSLKECICILK